MLVTSVGKIWNIKKYMIFACMATIAICAKVSMVFNGTKIIGDDLCINALLVALKWSKIICT